MAIVHESVVKDVFRTKQSTSEFRRGRHRRPARSRNEFMRSLLWRRTVIVAGIALLCLPLLACQTSSPPRGDGLEPDGPFNPPPPPSVVDLAAGEARAVYVKMWRAMAVAGETSDWRSTKLARYSTGDALTTITRALYTDHLNRVATQGRPKNSPRVTSVEPPNAPETVMISDCGDSSDTVKVFADSRKPINDRPGGRHSIVAEVKKQPDGAWRVTRFAVQGVGTC